MPQSGL